MAESSRCAVPRCGSDVFIRRHKLCKMHYTRWRRHGAVGPAGRLGRGGGAHGCADRPCTIEGCTSGVRISDRTMCAAHHRAAARRPRGPRATVQRINGYRFVRHEDGRIQAEHRIVMERLLGRRLARNETVHHRNGVRDDNRPQNLELWVIGHQPRGQRVADLVEWAREILAAYEDEVARLR